MTNTHGATLGWNALSAILSTTKLAIYATAGIGVGLAVGHSTISTEVPSAYLRSVREASLEMKSLAAQPRAPVSSTTNPVASFAYLECADSANKKIAQSSEKKGETLGEQPNTGILTQECMGEKSRRYDEMVLNPLETQKRINAEILTTAAAGGAAGGALLFAGIGAAAFLSRRSKATASTPT